MCKICYNILYNFFNFYAASPYGTTKRVRWTQTECNAIITAFKREMSEKCLPSGKQLIEVKMKNKCLSRRSIPQIRSWIHNQITRKSKSRANGNIFKKKILFNNI